MRTPKVVQGGDSILDDISEYNDKIQPRVATISPMARRFGKEHLPDPLSKHINK